MPKKVIAPSATHRRYDLDALRVIAIVAVITIHHVATVLAGKPIDSISWITADLIDSFLRWCVPVFVMISGALLIRKTTYEKPQEFFRKRLNRILIPLASWIVLYVVFRAAVSQTIPDISVFVQSILAGSPLYAGHLYFLFLIAGLYVLAPIISLYVFSVSRKTLWYTTIALCVATAVWNSIGYLPRVGGLELNMITQGLPYVGYFLLGYLLKDSTLNKKSETLYLALFIGSSLSIAAATYGLSKYLGEPFFGFYDYPGVLVVVQSISLFIIARHLYARLEESPRRQTLLRRIIDDLAQKSFGLYLVHIMVIFSLFRLFDLDRASLKSAIFILPLTILVSWMIVSVIIRIPKLQRIVS